MNPEDEINLRNISMMTAELLVADVDVVDANTRWHQLGNLPSMEYQPNAEHKETKIVVRGLKKTGKRFTTGIDSKYVGKAIELSSKIKDMLFFVDAAHDFGAAGADNSQAALAAVAGADFDFDQGADGVAVAVGQRVDLRAEDDSQVINASALILTGGNANYGPDADQVVLVEDVDYVHDAQLGQIRFLKAIDDDVITTSITAPAIVAGDGNYMLKRMPNQKGSIERMCRIYFFDQDDDSNLVMTHEDFRAHLAVSGGFTADGETDAEAQFEITPLTSGHLKVRQ